MWRESGAAPGGDEMGAERAGVQVKSMTGFGQGTAERDGVRAQVELKGVNHRFLDVKMKLPGEVSLLEPRLRAVVQERVTRARIDIAVAIVSSIPAPAQVVINEGLLAEYLKAVASLKEDFGLKGTVGLETVLTLPEEVALLAGRVDITEELVRLQGYLAEAENTLARPQGPIGKTLDFILQEMNREANTISSKAEALPICQEAIVIKAEVEKIREQVQNLE